MDWYAWFQNQVSVIISFITCNIQVHSVITMACWIAQNAIEFACENTFML